MITQLVTATQTVTATYIAIYQSNIAFTPEYIAAKQGLPSQYDPRGEYDDYHQIVFVGYEVGIFPGSSPPLLTYSPRYAITVINYHGRNSALPARPTYVNLLDGYYLDSRQKQANKLKLIPSKTGSFAIGYYRKNDLESSLKFQSIDWYSVTLSVVRGKPIYLDISLVVLGTMVVSDEYKAQIVNAATQPGKYPLKYLFKSNLPELFAHWSSLYQSALNAQPPSLPGIEALRVESNYSNKTLRKSASFNDHWDNVSLDSDIGFDPDHPMFFYDESSAIVNYFLPQADGSFGVLTMDSPKINDIWYALGAGKYAINELDESAPRVTNLGFLVSQIAKLLGLRLDANGKIDRTLEKSYEPKIIAQKKGEKEPNYNKDAYSTNCFGLHGRLLPRLVNSSDYEKAYDAVYDIPQLLVAIAKQQDIAMGLQDGTKLELPNAITGTIDKYPNQLAIQIDMLSKVTEIWQNTKETYNLSQVAANEQRELFSGIGVPVVQKELYTRYGALPYLGHQADKGSINTALTTLKINVGILVGAQLQQAPSKKNPFHKLLFKD